MSTKWATSMPALPLAAAPNEFPLVPGIRRDHGPYVKASDIGCRRQSRYLSYANRAPSEGNPTEKTLWKCGAKAGVYDFFYARVVALLMLLIPMVSFVLLTYGFCEPWSLVPTTAPLVPCRITARAFSERFWCYHISNAFLKTLKYISGSKYVDYSLPW